MSELTIELMTASPKIKRYYEEIKKKALYELSIAKQARSQGKDVSLNVDSLPTMDLADRCEAIVGPKGIAKRYRDLIKEMNKDRMKVMFRIFEEIITKKFGDIEGKEARLAQAIRTCLVLITEGVVVAPLDGIPRIKISKNFDGTEYADIYFAGPIRAAGLTAQVLPLILADYARKLLELDRYKPTDDEIERYVEEIEIYDELYARQNKAKPEEIRMVVKNFPVCINGEPTEEREVSAYRNLERIQGNRVRGGMCIVMLEGVLLGTKKICEWAKTLNLDWRWLEDMAKVTKDSGSSGGKIKEIKANWKYLDMLAAGRPIFAYPSSRGGFRLRYGSTRTTGLMAAALHPAVMWVSDEFIACGTQFKVERPKKASEVFPCGSIDGPIVRLKGGEVKKLRTGEEGKKLANEVEKILFLGDYLITLGDFRKAAHPLLPAGYEQGWWKQELKRALEQGKETKINVTEILKDPNRVSAKDAMRLSEDLKIPLHPEYIHYYSHIKNDDLKDLVKALKECEISKADEAVGVPTSGRANENVQEIKEMRMKIEIKNVLEEIGLEHKVENNELVVSGEYVLPLLRTLGYFKDVVEMDEKKSVLENINAISDFLIRDKSGSWVGARMGRPEQAKPREMTGNPHVLFPVGEFGTATRSVNKAIEHTDKKTLKREIEVELALWYCHNCKKIKELAFCDDCGGRNSKIRYCRDCKRIETDLEKKVCEKCGKELSAFNKRKIDVEGIAKKASNNVQTRMPDLVKGVKGLFGAEKVAEPLEKGILRAKHDVHMFKDGTIRYESLNAMITHFKPREIGLSVGKAIELGYTYDTNGTALTSDEQICELFPQDVIINSSGGDFFVKVANFIDDLLLRFYNLQPHFNAKTKEDLIGQLVLGIAPHTSAAIVGRVIGYSESRLLWQHPYFVCCKRRNLDGDQDSLLLLMDCLLNYSEHYLAAGRGGRMDAPLVFSIVLTPEEIDGEIYEREICKEYPLEFYEKTLEFAAPKEVQVRRVEHLLGKEEQYEGIFYSHDVECFDEGPKKTRYVQLKSMREKMDHQAGLQGRIKAVNQKDALEKVLMCHFLPDIIGNARGFSRQSFRCAKCNTIYRRPPLKGICTKCSNKLILTIAQGSVKKYLEIAKEICRKYELSSYLLQRLVLVEKEIDSVFKSDKQQQASLAAFM